MQVFASFERYWKLGAKNASPAATKIVDIEEDKVARVRPLMRSKENVGKFVESVILAILANLFKA